MKWIVKKTPVQLNPPSRTEIYNLRHGSTHQGETHDKAVGLARAQARIGLVGDGQRRGHGAKPILNRRKRPALRLALAGLFF
jgi:hypothetical protein